MDRRPHVHDAPGLTWRQRKGGWEARWRARSDVVARGYRPKIVALWLGLELSETDAEKIRTKCQFNQGEMLAWARGGGPKPQEFDGTLRSLISCYQTDPDSTYHKLRTRTRMNYDSRLRRVSTEHGIELVQNIRARQVKRWHEGWRGESNRVVAAHQMIAILRIVCRFGATMLEDEDCLRLAALLGQMRFPSHRPRNQAITAEQVIAFRRAAHEAGLPSMALGQAIQFECTLRQKDVIGEWVPLSAKEGISPVIDGNDKWLRGITWQEIDKNLILRHVTSKKQKEVVIDLRLAPMVMEELQQFQELPSSGPVLVCEITQRPWRTATWRMHWRKIARKCGIPDGVYNMDSRAGAITEATLAGAPIEHVRHAAAHSQVSQTADYARGQEEKVANVMRLRIEHRNKPKIP